MTANKYRLRKSDESFSIGLSNLNDSRGCMVDTNGCLVMIVTAGYGVATVNFQKRPLKRGCLILLFYDSTFSIDCISKSFKVEFASFSYELLEEAVYKPLSTDFWNVLFEKPVFETSEEHWNLIRSWMEQLKWIDRISNKSCKDELLKNYIRNLLIAIDTEVMRYVEAGILIYDSRHSLILIHRFFKLISLHCRETREVSFYAKQLSISTAYLYKLCRSILKISPKEAIDRQTITELKTYLVNTDMSVKRIAVELHFDDPSYMCRFFRKNTGVSPMDYRKVNTDNIELMP